LTTKGEDLNKVRGVSKKGVGKENGGMGVGTETTGRRKSHFSDRKAELPQRK